MFIPTIILIFVFLYFVFLYRVNLFELIRFGNKPNFDSKNVQELEKHSHYFKLLTNEEKTEFIQRVCGFLHSKRFITRGVLLNDELRLMIASYAVQITFGFDELKFSHFKTIVVYPAAYRSQITGQMHAGETHPKGAIVFSLRDLERGHAELNDGLNLALHEFAHALFLENNALNPEPDFINPAVIAQFNELARNEMGMIKQSKTHFLRNYAATNLHEFFAVCVENFFEKPAEFRSTHARLFHVMTQLLQQNPLNSPKRLINNFA